MDDLFLASYSQETRCFGSTFSVEAHYFVSKVHGKTSLDGPVRDHLDV